MAGDLLTAFSTSLVRAGMSGAVCSAAISKRSARLATSAALDVVLSMKRTSLCMMPT